MRILFVTTVWPTLPGRAGCQRLIHFAIQLKKLGHEVSLLCLSNGRAPQRDYFEIFSTVNTYAFAKVSIKRRVAHKLLNRSHLDISLKQPQAANSVKKLIEKAIFNKEVDRVICRGIEAAQLTPIDNDNVFVDLCDSLSLLLSSLLNSHFNLASFFDFTATKKLEKKIAKRAKNVIFISDNDRDYLRLSKAKVIPNGVTLPTFTPSPKYDSECSLMFSGVMGYPPNQEAARYLAKEIFPRILEKYPDCKLYLVGSKGDIVLRDIASRHNIIVTGTVDRVIDYLQHGWVYVCPLFSGAGLKNKLLEAFSMGIPVVASPLSIQGIKACIGRDILIAESPEDYVKCVDALISDEEYRKRIAKNARLLVEKEYSWEGVGKTLENLLINAP